MTERKHIRGRCYWQTWTRPHPEGEYGGVWICPPDCPRDAYYGQPDHDPESPIE